MRSFILAALFASFVAVPQEASAQVFDPLDFAGLWDGRWENLTFGSKDSASMTVTIDTATKGITVVLDLDGNVFGGSDPAPITLTGSYDDDGFSVSGSQAPYGDLSLSGDTAGNLTGRAVNVPNVGIDSVTMSGTYDEIALALAYVVHFAFGGGTANGIITMEKQTPTSVGEGVATVPSRVTLSRNYPNPFNPSTELRYELPAAAQVRLAVHDLLGREVAVLVDGIRPAGVHSMKWDAAGQGGGIYFSILESAGERRIVKMLLVK